MIPSMYTKKEMIESKQEVSKDLEKALQTKECQQVIAKIKRNMMLV